VFATDDTIVAIATPLGRGGIGVVRVSGPDAERIACELIARERPFEPRHATLGRLQAPPSRPVASVSPNDLRPGIDVSDQVVITMFVAPHSYTGEDVAEISAHGSPVVLDSILRRALAAGARLAEPGEFTLRAFLHAKLDLVQAEAVADLIDAVTPLQARAAFDQLEGTLTCRIGSLEAALFDLITKLEASLDFPAEGYHFIEPHDVASSLAAIISDLDALLRGATRGRLLRDGAQVAIVGAPNVGKSSLFNALLNANRAIVTPVAGTTRDLLTEQADIRGMSVMLVDTAGIRETDSQIEQEGVARARGAALVADLVLVVLDRSRRPDAEDETILASTASRPRIVVMNKTDLPAVHEPREAAVEVSVLAGQGLDTLAEAIAAALGSATDHRDQPRVTNLRHITLLENARAALMRAQLAVGPSTARSGVAVRASESGTAIPEEFVLADLAEASHLLQEVTGKRTSEDLLASIFERFCIGK
jgi:tRNA modification GTPase